MNIGYHMVKGQVMQLMPYLSISWTPVWFSIRVGFLNLKLGLNLGKYPQFCPEHFEFITPRIIRTPASLAKYGKTKWSFSGFRYNKWRL